MNELLTNIWDGVRRVLEYPLLNLGDHPLTLLTILNLLLWTALVFLAEFFLRRSFLTHVLQRTRLHASLQYGISRILGYLFIAVGLYAGLQFAGFNLSSLAFVAGAIGVGLGFGLQHTVNNFVSGLIILIERPITLGDRVEVGGVAGLVRQINLRSTLVVTNDNISIIVPNSEFITHPITNWSHGDPKVRLRLPLGVAYGSDVEKLRRVLLAVAAAHPMVLRDPAPDLFFLGFGESSLDFELAIWTAEMAARPRRFRSELYYEIEKTLREHHIEIPFPQRDLHVRSGSLVVPSSSTQSGRKISVSNG